MAEVPFVDISNPTATSMEALDAACRSHGFFLLDGHGLDDLIARTWRETERFFDSDQTIRDAIRRDADLPFGYNDRELTKRLRDHKQVFDFGDPTVARLEAMNRWPEGLDGFRDTMLEFHASMGRFVGQTMALLHDALELTESGRAVMAGDTSTSTVRLNHYPLGDPVPEDQRAGLAELGPTALGYHTDPGVITLLLQDSTGGLQTRTRSGDWINVDPMPGTVVVNLGDAMQVWTNDRYQAAVHRVVPMTQRRRFSIPYFCNPSRSAQIEPLAELSPDGARYRSFGWMDFMRSRNADNFEDVGAADAQISDYLVS